MSFKNHSGLRGTKHSITTIEVELFYNYNANNVIHKSRRQTTISAMKEGASRDFADTLVDTNKKRSYRNTSECAMVDGGEQF